MALIRLLQLSLIDHTSMFVSGFIDNLKNKYENVLHVLWKSFLTKDVNHSCRVFVPLE